MGFWSRIFGKYKSCKDFRILLKEIDSLSKPEEKPRKIMLLQHSLTLFQRQSNPELWAYMQGELGNSLCQNPLGNRGNNIEQAIEHYGQAMEVFTYQNFPVEWAATQMNLGNAYKNRIQGNRTDNIEQAIVHYNQALKVRTFHYFPVEWAMTQNNLGNAYKDRIKEDKAENIEKAIEHCNQTLEVFTYPNFPAEWATTQNNLGLAYIDRIRGIRAENIEKAIEHFNQALKVRTYHDFPVEWAKTHSNLGNAYIDRIRGIRSENIEKAVCNFNQALDVYTYHNFPVEWARIQNDFASAYHNCILGDKSESAEKAIEYYNQSLNVLTQKDFPVDWAETQNNLANVYCIRAKGDRIRNIEQAIEYHNQALKIFKQKDFPVQWATTQNNLGNAYKDRIKGDKAENIEKTIECYNKSLEVRTYQDFPMEWAVTQNSLGSAYIDRIRGDQIENIEQAICHCEKALKMLKYRDFPMDWSMTQNNLGNAYLNRTSGDRAENIDKAIEYYNQALEVRNYQDFPMDWAGIQNNLAIAYINRIRGNRAENIEKALSHSHNALKIYKLESTPNNFRNAYRFLGDLYLDMDQWENAVESYKNAIKTGDLLYRSGLSAESKNLEVRENAYVYKNASLAEYHLGLAENALLTLERGKTRLLSESLRLKMKQPEGVPKGEWQKYENAARKYRTVTKLTAQEDYSQWENIVQKALEELDVTLKVAQSYNPEFQKELDISDILLIPNEETALLTFCISDKGSIGFVISRSNGVVSVDIPDFNTEDLNNLLFKPDEQGRIKGGWVGDYRSYTNALGTESYKDAFQTWQRILSDILFSIGARLFDPLLSELPSQIKRLILLPSGGLSLLPLHAVLLSGGQPVCQRYCISYVPSIQLLRELQNKARTVQRKGLYAVINPQEDPTLVFSEFEGQAISKLFRSHQVSVGYTGTRATVLDRIPKHAYLHFSCHGSYNWNDPLKSALYLVGGRTLSLADLQSEIVDMSSARLVTLSACETGMIDIIKSSADEFVGLPAGFMLAGVPCVVSSLWSVPDISTALLMEQFYSNHIDKKMDIPQALQDAQLWVRDLTSSQVANYVEKCYHSGKWEDKSKEFIEQHREHYLKMAKESPEEKPFQHPYYWAAFTVNGA